MNKTYTNWIILFLVFIIIGCICFLLLKNRINIDQTKNVALTKAQLNSTREILSNYYKDNGRYPETIQAAQEYYSTKIDLVERLSSSKSNNIVHDSLNGNGGWYYNKNNGEIKVNLVKPVKDYLKLYAGKYKNEIPSDW